MLRNENLDTHNSETHREVLSGITASDVALGTERLGHWRIGSQ
jgi:hypothetical protein